MRIERGPTAAVVFALGAFEGRPGMDPPLSAESSGVSTTPISVVGGGGIGLSAPAVFAVRIMSRVQSGTNQE
jgi:hypothetical protein